MQAGEQARPSQECAVMPQRADTPTQRRGLAPELAASPEAKPHRSCSASLSPSTLLSRASSASPSFIFSSKLLCSCGRARGRVTRTETSRNTCFLGLRCAAASYKHPGSRAGSAQPPCSTCGMFSPALNLHARDRQTRAAAAMTDSGRPTPLPQGYGQGTSPSPSPLPGQGGQSQTTACSYCTVRFMTLMLL